VTEEKSREDKAEPKRKGEGRHKYAQIKYTKTTKN
jgi:hypothetical protein